MRLTNGGTLLAALVVASLVAVAGGAGTATVAAQEDCSFPVSEVDATGTEVTVEEEPDRIVTLSPSAAQTMWEIGAKEKVVGVTKYATYLDGADEKQNISGSGFTAIVPEKVVAAEPDLVLAPNNVADETVESLRERGLTVYKFRASETLEDIVAKTELTGRLVGECEGAGETAAEMESDIALIEETVEGEDRRLVLYEFSGGYTAGEGTFVHALIEKAGARNLAAEAGIEGYMPISEEVVVERDPEFLIQTTRSPEPPATTAYNETTAVREGNVVVVNNNYLNQPAPRTIDAVRAMVKAFHPEAYQEALATPTATASPTGTEQSPDDGTPTGTDRAADTETPTASATATDVSTSVPGLGVAPAVAAVAVAALLFRRR